MTATRAATGRALGYTRVSTRRQDLSPLAQAERLGHRAAERGWQLETVEERVSGRSVSGRPALREALARLSAGEFDALLVDKMDRCARNLRDFLTLDEQAQREGWALIVLNLDFDSSTATGRLVRNVMAAIAEWERGIIGERTAEALAAKRANEPAWRPGRPVALTGEVRARLVALRDLNLTLAQVAACLNAERCLTPTGLPWTATNVAGTLARIGKKAS